MKKLLAFGFVFPLSILLLAQSSNNTNQLIPYLTNSRDMLDSSKVGSYIKPKYQYVYASNRKLAFEGVFEKASLFNPNGYAVVESNGNYSVIQSTGKIVYNSTFPLKVSMSGFIRIQKGNLFGLLDPNGKVVLEPQYSDILSIDNSSIFKVVLNQKMGLFAGNGKWLTEIKWDDIAGGEYKIQEFKENVPYKSEFFSKFFDEFKENFTLLQFFSKNKKEMVSINKNGNDYTMKLISPKYYDNAKIDEDFPFYIHFTTYKKNGKQITTELRNLMGTTLYQCQENFKEKNEKSQLQVNFIANLLGLKLDETNKDVKLTEQLVLQVPSPKNSELNLLTIVDLFGKKLVEITLSDDAEINDEIGFVHSNDASDSFFYLYDIGKLKHVAYVRDRKGKVKVFQRIKNNQFRIFENKALLYEVVGNQMNEINNFYVFSDSTKPQLTILTEDLKEKYTLNSHPKGKIEQLHVLGKEFVFFKSTNSNQYFLYDLQKNQYLNKKWNGSYFKGSTAIFLDSEGYLYRYADGQLVQWNYTTKNQFPNDVNIENYNSVYTQMSFQNDSIQFIDAKGKVVSEKIPNSNFDLLLSEDERLMAFLIKTNKNQYKVLTSEQIEINQLRSGYDLTCSGAFVAEQNGNIYYFNQVGLKLKLHQKVNSIDSSDYSIFSFCSQLEGTPNNWDFYKFDVVYNDFHKIYWIIFKNKIIHSGKYKGDFTTDCIKSNVYMEECSNGEIQNDNQTWVLSNGINRTYFMNINGNVDSIENIINKASYDCEFLEFEYTANLGLIKLELNKNGAEGIWNMANRNWLIKPENHTKLNIKFNPDNGVEDGKILFLRKDTLGWVLSVYDNQGKLIFPIEEYQKWQIHESESSQTGNLFELKKSDTSTTASVHYRVEPNLSLVKFTPNVAESTLSELQLDFDYFQTIENDLIYFNFLDALVLMDKFGNAYWDMK